MIHPYTYVGLIQEDDLGLIKSKIDIIIDQVCLHSNVDKKEIFLLRRFHESVKARHIAFYFLYKFTNLSYNEIGRMFGGKDHTTIMHGINKVSDYLDIQDEYYVNIVNLIEQSIARIYEVSKNISQEVNQDKLDVTKYIKTSRRYERERSKIIEKNEKRL
jgi:hypothetical protein